MKSIILLTIIACSYGAKLNRGYLPPEHAQTSSGSEFLETPISQPIVVAEEAVFHKSNAEANLGPQHQQTINGFVQIGSHGSGFPHGIEANAAGLQHQQPNNGFIQVGSHASSLAHGAEALEHVNLKVVEQRPERTQAAIERHAAILRQDYQNDGKGYAYVYETDNGIYGEENGVATHGVIAQGAFSYTGDDGVQYSITYTADENGFQPHGDHLPTPPPIPEEILKSLEQNARDEAAGIFDDGSYHAEKYGDKAEYIANDAHIENQGHAVIINEHEPVVHAEEGEAVVNTVLLPEPIQRPIFRNPGLEHQVVVNVPVVASNVNKAYLPPVHQAVLEDNSAQNGKIVFGTRHRQPSFNSKKGYKY